MEETGVPGGNHQPTASNQRDPGGSYQRSVLELLIICLSKTFKEITRARGKILNTDVNDDLQELLHVEKTPPTPDLEAWDHLTAKIRPINEGNQLKGQSQVVVHFQGPERALGTSLTRSDEGVSTDRL